MSKLRVHALLGLLPFLVFGPACSGSDPRTPADARCTDEPRASTQAGPASSEATSTSVTPRTADEVAAEIVRRINEGNAEAVVAMFGEPMRKAFPLEKTGPFVRGVVSEKGKLVKLEREPGKGNEQHGVYRLEAERGDWTFDLHVDKDGKVLGMKLTEPPPPAPPVAKSTIPLGLPFKAPFFVFWGGDRLEINQHVTHASQRRAADISMVDADGKSHRDDGKKNGDYFVYGQEVLAVADGNVVTAIDGVPENEPGTMNPYIVPGNLVILKHGDALYSAYAHLQPGKLRVKEGTKVKRGQVLGLAGNSGNSSEPHLHFQLQDGPRFEKSWGVEPVFANVPVKRDGTTTTIAEYTFLKGDIVGAPR